MAGSAPESVGFLWGLSSNENLNPRVTRPRRGRFCLAEYKSSAISGVYTDHQSLETRCKLGVENHLLEAQILQEDSDLEELFAFPRAPSWEAVCVAVNWVRWEGCP